MTTNLNRHGMIQKSQRILTIMVWYNNENEVFNIMVWCTNDNEILTTRVWYNNDNES